MSCGLLAVLIVVGNSLTIWIFLRQKFRKRAHFLLISLAAADLLVGLLTVPLYMVVNLDTCAAETFYASVYMLTFAPVSLLSLPLLLLPWRGCTLSAGLFATELSACVLTSLPLSHRGSWQQPSRLYGYCVTTI